MLKVVQNLLKTFSALAGVLCLATPFTLLMGGGATATNIDTSVIIRPSLTVNIPANSITMNLDPANHDFDEKDLTVTVGTNNRSGFKLYVTTSNNSTDLVNIADSTKIIPNLTSSTTTASFPANNWGYRITQDSTSSSGNYGIFTSSSSAPIIESSSPVNEKIATLGFGAKIDYAKPSGTYELGLNFKALPTITSNYMQDIVTDPTVCTEEPTVVIDKRDEQAYTIGKINNTCWMIDNLRFTGTTLDSSTSNISPIYTSASPLTLAYYDLVDNGSSGDRCNGTYNGGDGIVANIESGDGYTYPCLHKGSNEDSSGETVWYNFVAASAGSITGTVNANVAEYDICPAGWRLPSNYELRNMTSYIAEATPTAGGFYVNGSIQGTNLGYWYSSAASGNATRYYLSYNSNSDTASVAPSNHRMAGSYIRCVLNTDSDITINDITKMQDFLGLNTTEKTKVISSMTANQDYSLQDTRDSKTYKIRKLSDGKVWMSQNLAYQKGTLYPVQTNVTTNKIISSCATSTGYCDLANATTTTSPCYGSYGGTITGGSYNNACLYSSGSNTWYNYAAASAGSIVGTNNTAETTQDICPAGWKLPSQQDINGVISYFASTNPGYGGYYANGVLENSSTHAYWLSSTASGQATRYYLSYVSGSTSIGTANFRMAGSFIRCLVK